MGNSNQQDGVAEKEGFWSKANRGIDTANKFADLIGKGRDIYTDIRGPSTAQIYRTFPGEMPEKVMFDFSNTVFEYLQSVKLSYCC